MSRAKFRALVHYIVAKSEPARLGAIRLNKILFYVDALTYRSTGKSLTGETYIKRQHGPVSKSAQKILGDLEHDNAIVIGSFDRFGKQMRGYIPRADPDLSVFEPHELRLIESVREHICSAHTAMSISELSHDHVWEAANIGEPIPMAATLASGAGEITKDVKKWAESAFKRYEAINKAAA